MSIEDARRPITVVSACIRKDGFPTFAVHQVEVTPDEAENGVHYYLVEADLLEEGFEEPFVHFDEHEAPPFLLPAVQQYLAHSDNSNNHRIPLATTEDH